MKSVIIIFLMSLISTLASAATKCDVVANKKLNQALRTLGLPPQAKVQLLPPKSLKNHYGNWVLIYQSANIHLSETSNLSNGSASIVLNSTDCSPLKMEVELFSGVDRRQPIGDPVFE